MKKKNSTKDVGDTDYWSGIYIRNITQKSMLKRPLDIQYEIVLCLLFIGFPVRNKRGNNLLAAGAEMKESYTLIR